MGHRKGKRFLIDGYRNISQNGVTFAILPSDRSITAKDVYIPRRFYLWGSAVPDRRAKDLDDGWIEIIDFSDTVWVETCPHCDHQFVLFGSSAKFCSDKCRKAWHARNRYPLPPECEPQTLMLEYHAQPKLLEWHGIECDHCGESFKPKRKSAKYCSGRCRQAAHRRKQAAQ